MGWCLSAFCFMIEVLYNRVFGQKSWILEWVENLLNLSIPVVTQQFITHNSPVSSLASFQRVN
jgi:hypothetical protein